MLAALAVPAMVAGRLLAATTPSSISAHGSDTITGSGRGDTVFFDSQAYGSGSGISIFYFDSVTTVYFTETSQSFKIQGVSTLQFSDGHVIP
jgi:hypothetical protein